MDNDYRLNQQGFDAQRQRNADRQSSSIPSYIHALNRQIDDISHKLDLIIKKMEQDK